MLFLLWGSLKLLASQYRLKSRDQSTKVSQSGKMKTKGKYNKARRARTINFRFWSEAEGSACFIRPINGCAGQCQVGT